MSAPRDALAVTSSVVGDCDALYVVPDVFRFPVETTVWAGVACASDPRWVFAFAHWRSVFDANHAPDPRSFTPLRLGRAGRQARLLRGYCLGGLAMASVPPPRGTVLQEVPMPRVSRSFHSLSPTARRPRGPAATLVLGLMLIPGTSALAGQNANGSLLFHYDPAIVYSQGTDYCDSPTLDDGCAYQDNLVTTTSDVLLHVFAVFPANPRMSGLTFGIDYDSSTVSILDSGTCADLVITTDDWPLPGSGCGMSWLNPVTEPLTEIAWFAAAVDTPLPSELRLVAHPILGANFADDSIPSILDPIACLGALGFYWASGRCCPVAAAPAHETGSVDQVSLSLRVVPSPSNRPAIDLRLTQSDTVHLRLFDVAGRALWSHEESYGSGLHQVMIPVSASGVFFVTASSTSSTATAKIVIQ